MELNNAELKEDTLKKYNEVLHGYKQWNKGYWDGIVGKERAKICTKYLCENVLKFSDKDFEYRITKNMFNKHKLGYMIKKNYDDAPDNAVIDAFPEKVKLIVRQQNISSLEKEIKELIPDMFKSESSKKNVIEKIISYLDCEEKDIPKKLSSFTFSKFNLKDVLEKYYNSSVFKFVEEVRPGIFKPWEFDHANTTSYLYSFTWYSTEV